VGSDERKALIRRFVEEVWNDGNLDALAEFVTPDFMDHTPEQPEPVQGVEAIRRLVSRCREAFPDARFTIHDMIAERDRVAWRWTARGTHAGDLPGLLATGRQVTTTGIEIYRVAGMRIAERWGVCDRHGLARQLDSGSETRSKNTKGVCAIAPRPPGER